MAFAPDRNPRHRRALADARVAGLAALPPDTTDFQKAVETVRRIGDGKKGKAAQRALFARLARIALQDPSTRVIVDAAQATLDPEQTPSYAGADTVHVGVRGSQDLSFISRTGALMVGYRHPGDTILPSVHVTIFDGRDQSEVTIPTTASGVDVVGVHMLPDRESLASSLADTHPIQGRTNLGGSNYTPIVTSPSVPAGLVHCKQVW